MNQDKKKLLIMTSSFPKYPGDINGNFIYELAVRLKNDFEIFVLAPAFYGSMKYEIIDGIKIYRHDQFFIKKVELAYGSHMLAKINRNFLYIFVVPVFIIFQLFTLRKIIKKEKINLVNAHWLLPQGFVAVLYKVIFNINIKIFLTSHGTDVNSFNNLLGRKIKVFVLKRIDELMVVSNALKRKIIEIGYNKEINVCPMGVDTNVFSPEKRNNTLKEKFNICGIFLLFVGEVIERKGIRYLIQAMPLILKEYPDAKLMVIGEGNLKNEMIELTEQLGINENVLFLGSVPHKDLPPYFATADIFILPSLSEGWPVVVMESLSTGTKTIVTKIPVFENLDKKEELFSLVPIKDSNAIANEIIFVLKRGEHLTKSDRLRYFAQSVFDWSVVANKYKNLILRLLE